MLPDAVFSCPCKKNVVNFFKLFLLAQKRTEVKLLQNYFVLLQIGLVLGVEDNVSEPNKMVQRKESHVFLLKQGKLRPS